MRYFRQLPLFLRVMSVLGLVFGLASVLMILAMIVLFITGGDVFRQELSNDHRAFTIALNLSMVGQACAIAVHRYTTRFRQPYLERFPLDSWQRQARAIALLAALPLCAIILAAVIPLTQDAAYLAVSLISIIAAVMLVRAYVRLGMS